MKFLHILFFIIVLLSTFNGGKITEIDIICIENDF